MISEKFTYTNISLNSKIDVMTFRRICLVNCHNSELIGSAHMTVKVPTVGSNALLAFLSQLKIIYSSTLKKQIPDSWRYHRHLYKDCM